MAGDAQDRTEAATPKRVQKARDEGQVALSREAAPAAVLAAMALTLAAVAPSSARSLAIDLSAYLAQAHALDPMAAARGAVAMTAAAVLPFAGAAALAGSVAVLGQTGFLVNLPALMPDLARLSPGRQLGRVLNGGTLAEAGRSAAKFAVVGIAAWTVLRSAWPGWTVAMSWTPPMLLHQLQRIGLRLVLMALAFQAVMAGADILRARLSLAGQLRMSRHDLREEQREADGDPLIKNKLRRMRAQRAKRRMMAAVPHATVVVTNPTHYAVALVYQRGGNAAPRVVAKGVDSMAARIRKVAEAARVPLVPDPPLARALYQVELDAEIPAELFQAVAAVIAAVWRLRSPRRVTA